MKCAIKDCELHARRRPVIVMRSTKSPKASRAVLNIGCCDKHAKTRTIDDFLTPAGWLKLVRHSVENGGAVPERSLSTLEWSRAK